MPRTLSETEKLARWFCEEIMGQKWQYNTPLAKMLLRQSKELVNPAPDPATGEKGRALPADKVKKAVHFALADLRKATPDYKPLSLKLVTFQSKSGKTYYDAANEIPAPPPKYEKVAYMDWLARYGADYLQDMMGAPQNQRS